MKSPSACTIDLGPPVTSHLGFMAYPRSTNHPLHLDPLFRALSPPLTNWPSTEHQLASQTDSPVLNSKHFSEMMEDVIVDKGETMLRFDVSSPW